MALGRGWADTWCGVANFFLGLLGGTPLVPPENTLMDGVAAVLAALGLGLAIWLYGAVRNSATRYIWVLATRSDHAPRKELRRRLRGRRLAQLGTALINLALWAPFALVAGGAVKGVITDVSDGLMTAIAQQSLPVIDLAAAVGPLFAAFLLLYMPLLPVRRMLTAAFAVRSGAADRLDAAAHGGASAAPAYVPGNGGDAPRT